MDEAEVRAAAYAAISGDEAAFATLVRATQAAVIRTCAALVDAGSADDLAQETYLRAFQALPSFDARSSVRTWVLGIARHVCVDEVRRRHRRRALLRRLPSSTAVTAPAPATELEMLIGSLPADQREAFVLTQIIGLRYDETAEVCGCPVGTIRSRVARARATLVENVAHSQLA